MDVNEYFAIDDVITFSTIQPSVLGANYTRVKVLALLDSETAKLFIDPVALHASIYPDMAIPDQVTYKKYSDYKYIKIKLQDGSVTALGLPWIVMTNNMVSTNVTSRFTVALNHPDETQAIVELLKANGWYNIVVEEL